MLRLIPNCAVIGFNRSQFDRDGSTVYGYNVTFQYPFTAEGAAGYGAGSVWVSKKFFDDNYIEIGSSLQIARSRVGDRYKFEIVG